MPQNVRLFATEKKLSEYTLENCKFFPKENAHAGGLLKYLLRHIMSPSEVPRGQRKNRIRRGWSNGIGRSQEWHECDKDEIEDVDGEAILSLPTPPPPLQRRSLGSSSIIDSNAEEEDKCVVIGPPRKKRRTLFSCLVRSFTSMDLRTFSGSAHGSLQPRDTISAASATGSSWQSLALHFGRIRSVYGCWYVMEILLFHCFPCLKF